MTTRRPTIQSLPPAGPERTAALEALAADLVKELGPTASLMLATLLDERVAELELKK